MLTCILTIFAFFEMQTGIAVIEKHFEIDSPFHGGGGGGGSKKRENK